MAISTYAELQTAVGSWLARDNLTAIIPDLIMIGEKWLFRKARTRDMETALSVTISGGTATVPTDFLAIKHARIDGSPSKPLRVRPATWIMERYPTRSSDGKPGFIAADGSTFIFGPFPDSGYTVLGIYYARPAVIATSANAVFTANPDLYLFAALAEAYPYLKGDARVPLWIAKRDTILADVNLEAQEGRQDTAMEVTVDA